MSAIQKRLDKMEIAFDQEAFVVIDMGSGYIKAGFAGEDLPRCIIPTAVAEQTIKVEEPQSNQPGASDVKPKTHYTFGNQAIDSRETHEYCEPIQRGLIVDIDRIEKLLDHIFTHELEEKSSSLNVLMTDSPINSKENKKQLCDLMFEKFKVSSFSLMNTAALSLFSTGTTTGLVAECGHGLSYAVPIFEGFALPHGIQTLSVAGQDVTEKLMKEIMVDEKAVKVDHIFKVREMKEQMCHVAYSFEDEITQRDDPLTQEQRQYELPTGEIIEVDQRKRIQASEIIFNPRSNPSYEGQEVGIAQMAFDAIEKCDSDLKINLYNNIVLAGGTTLMRGFTDRFDLEIRDFAEQSAKTDINVSAALHRKFAAWIGGSMLASFSTFSGTAIKQKEYMEGGQESERGQCILKKSVF